MTKITTGSYPVYTCVPNTLHQGPSASINITSINGPFVYFDSRDFPSFQCFSTPYIDMSNGIDISFDATIDTNVSSLYFGVRVGINSIVDSSLFYVIPYTRWFTQGRSGWLHFEESLPAYSGATAHLVFDYDGSIGTALAIDNLVIKPRTSCPNTTICNYPEYVHTGPNIT